MSKKNLVIIHDLSKLTPADLTQYLRDVSEFIGLDPDLNGLDTIWMRNENGPGQSLVVYARRGTAEILRNKLGIEVTSLNNQMVKDSLVFTATGKNKEGRQEIATGSKNIGVLAGKTLDDAIMTASTRALRRLTMQFTSLGILDESEVSAIVGDTSNPAAAAALSGSAMVIPPPPTAAINSAPGRDVTPIAAPQVDVPAAEPFVGQKAHIEAAWQQLDQKKAETDGTVTQGVTVPTPAKRGRKPKNTVSLEGPEPEVVNGPAVTLPSAPVPALASPLIPADAPISALVPPTPPPSVLAAPPSDFAGKPTDTQMADYRKRVSVYTSELPSSENLGSVQKMRAFITKMSGTAPQFMTTDQWEEQLSWFESFVAKNQIKGLVKYINDMLGVK
jgi:hypothetical protein